MRTNTPETTEGRIALPIEVSESEIVMIVKKAARRRMTVSAYVREVFLRELHGKSDKTK